MVLFAVLNLLVMKNLLKKEPENLTSEESNQKWKLFAKQMKDQLQKLKKKGIELPIFTL